MMRSLALVNVMLLAACSQHGERPALDRDSSEGLRPVIGHLRGRDYSVTIYSGEDGPRYTVKTHSGEIVADSQTAAGLEATHPELFRKVRALIADQRESDEIWADIHPLAPEKASGASGPER